MSWPSLVNGTCLAFIQNFTTGEHFSEVQSLKALEEAEFGRYLTTDSLCYLSHRTHLIQVTADWRREEKSWADMWNRRLTNREYCWTVKLCVEIICSVVINVVWVDGRCYCKCDCYDSLVIPIFRGPITNSLLNETSWEFLWQVVCVPLTEPKAVKMFLEWLYISVGP